jgi:hypothetical protein
MATEKVTSNRMPDTELKKRRSAARKTAALLGVVVLLIFAAFILSGVFGRA